MSASTLPPATPPHFSADELTMLAKTADALSAYLGKPVLAEVSETDSGAEWVAFGVPLQADAKEKDEELTHVQMGGPQARLLGNRGGLPINDIDVYDCLYLWAIEVTSNEGERFVKLDQEGEEAAWSDDLGEMLPFALSDDGILMADDSFDDDDDDEEEDPDDDEIGDDFGELPPEPRPPLRRH